MNIEEEIFKRTKIEKNKLIKYGFKEKNKEYFYSKEFENNTFRADIKIDKNNKITGKVIDLETNEEYLNIRIKDIKGEFANQIKTSYQNILEDIKNNCTSSNYFIGNQTNHITQFIENKYHNHPEFLWEKYDGFGVFRNKTNKKWYAIIMNIDYSKIDNKTGEVEIINLKINIEEREELLKKEGIYKAYHMNHNSWITIVLNYTLKDEEIIKLIEKSYNLVNEKEEWIIPANPNYFDIINCFNDTNTIIWKQCTNIHVGDILYLYVGNPYSRIFYQCKVIETDIPYSYKDSNLSIKNVMKIELIKKYDNEKYNFEYLKQLGIKAIRGPRKITKEISNCFK